MRSPQMHRSERAPETRFRRPARTRLTLLFVGLALTGIGAQTDPRQRSAYWLSTYGEVPPDCPGARSARRVFEKLTVIAYPRPERPPRLLLLNKEGDPYAIALEDGGIILTRTGLELCRRAGADSTEARLAFVLGHELAHLANQDFWHLSAFMALHSDSSKLDTELNDLLVQDGKADQQIELKADQSGLLQMTMAGYDPWEILGPKGSFFHEWVAQASQSAADPSHPDPGTRERYLRLELDKIARRLDLFRFGVRFLETRQLDRAIELLSEFRVTFAGPAVLNNLGLAHYLRGFWSLAKCDGRLAMRFRLPIQIDPWTLASRSRNRGNTGAALTFDECGRNPDFVKARQALKRAIELAPDYRPARLNYASLLLTTEEYAEAALALQQSVGEPETEMLSLLAFYLLGRSSRRFDTSESTIREFETLARSQRESIEIAYNHASIVQELKGSQAAAPLWRRFLELEPVGQYADHAREQLGDPPSSRGRTVAALMRPQGKRPQAPGPLGELTQAGRDWLAGVDGQPTEMRAGKVLGKVYLGPRIRALLVIGLEDAKIALIEERPSPALTRTEAMARFGPPLWRVSSPGGEFLLYPGFGLDLARDQVTAIVHYR